MLDGESDTIGGDDFGLSLFVVEKYGIHVFGALPLKDQWFCLTQQPVGRDKW